MSEGAKEQQSIDLNALVKRLPPDKMGQFEPISGVMVINLSGQQYQASAQRWANGEATQSDRELINTINHETFHFVQTTLCGYMFDRARRLFNVLNTNDMAVINALDAAEEEADKIRKTFMAVAGEDQSLQKRADDMAKLTYYQERLAIFEKHAPKEDHSLASAFMPHFFSFRQTLLEEEARTDDKGLSILGVVEGAAVVFTAHLMRDERSISQRIEADIAHLPSLYSEAWKCCYAALGEPAVDLLLPISAVALCYEVPNAAFQEVLSKISGLSVEQSNKQIAELFHKPNSIVTGGEYLGTGWDMRKNNDSFILYDTVLKLWDCEERSTFAFDLLATPMALNKIDKLPICLTLSDAFISGQVSKDEAHAKIYLASLVLKVLSRRREEKDFEKFSVRWAQGVIGRLI